MIDSKKVLEVWLQYESEGFSVISTPGKTCNVFEKNKTKKDQFEENPGKDVTPWISLDQEVFFLVLQQNLIPQHTYN